MNMTNSIRILLLYFTIQQYLLVQTVSLIDKSRDCVTRYFTFSPFLSQKNQQLQYNVPFNNMRILFIFITVFRQQFSYRDFSFKTWYKHKHYHLQVVGLQHNTIYFDIILVLFSYS